MKLTEINAGRLIGRSSTVSVIGNHVYRMICISRMLLCAVRAFLVCTAIVVADLCQ